MTTFDDVKKINKNRCIKYLTKPLEKQSNKLKEIEQNIYWSGNRVKNQEKS